MRVLVTGSRHWRDRPRIFRFMQSLPRHAVLIHGDSPRGVDRLADLAAKNCGLRVEPYPVVPWLDGPWPAAGVRRNSRMVEESRPDIAVAFRAPGKSNGTDDCIAKARKRGADCFVLLEGEPHGEEAKSLATRLATGRVGADQGGVGVRKPQAPEGEGSLSLF